MQGKVTKAKWNFRKKLYVLWTALSLVILYLISANELDEYLLWIVVVLLLKDIFIDLGCFGLFKTVFVKRGSWPTWLEHAPFAVLVVIGGLLGVLEVSLWTVIIAGADAVLDVLDDMGVI